MQEFETLTNAHDGVEGVGAAVLTVALAATIYSSAEARSSEARSSAARSASAPSAASAAGLDPTAKQQAGSINAALDAEISGIINANSQCQIGVALIDLSDDVVHQYGVQKAFVAASTAKVLAAEA